MALANSHLFDRPRSEAATAGMNVRNLMEHQGWPDLMDAVERQLREEQRILMLGAPKSDAENQREIGKWTGLRAIKDLAADVVEAGERAEQEMRNDG